MTANAEDTSRAWIDPDDAPEWSADQVARAALVDGERVVNPARGTLTRRGRPPLANPKRQVTLRLDADIVSRLRAGGPGWQSRINEILRREVGG
jgi:uncharacterized protein (DUF4415 family)